MVVAATSEAIFTLNPFTSSVLFAPMTNAFNGESPVAAPNLMVPADIVVTALYELLPERISVPFPSLVSPLVALIVA